MKTHIITILLNLHNTLPPRSRGILPDSPVRISIEITVFSQICVKVSKLSTGNLNKCFENHGTSFFGFLANFLCRFR